jgi:hypothetical protein
MFSTISTTSSDGGDVIFDTMMVTTKLMMAPMAPIASGLMLNTCGFADVPEHLELVDHVADREQQAG